MAGRGRTASDKIDASTPAVAVQVFDLQDRVEVTGRSAEEVRAALRLYDAAGRLRGRLRADMTDTLLEAAAAVAGPVTDVADATMARRLAAHRARLLETGYETYESLAARRGAQASTVRAWVARNRESGALFTVKQHGRTLIPAVQLTQVGALEPTVSTVVAALRLVGLDGWQLWGWLCSPSGWLDGEVPAEVVSARPGEVRAAAAAYAEELAATAAITP